MIMKIGRMEIRSSFSRNGKGSAKTSSASRIRKTGVDSFKKSALSNQINSQTYSGLSASKLSDIQKYGQTATVAGNKFLGTANIYDDYKGKAEKVFSALESKQKNLNDSLTQKLRKAGVPADTEFEFDYDMDAKKAVVTKISDEKYLDAVENALNNSAVSEDIGYMAYASRIMNGNISSVFYSDVSDMLDTRFGQDISELYIDKKGSLQGANKSLKSALANEKLGIGNKLTGNYGFNYNSKTYFDSSNVEALIKRLISDKKITPNVSHIGYGKNGIYTNDGDFKFGKKINKDIFNDKRTAMRGSIALKSGSKGYDLWLANEKNF